eukprot:10931623-Lingulodinium_polyedra.AAC.1
MECHALLFIAVGFRRLKKRSDGARDHASNNRVQVLGPRTTAQAPHQQPLTPFSKPTPKPLEPRTRAHDSAQANRKDQPNQRPSHLSQER